MLDEPVLVLQTITGEIEGDTIILTITASNFLAVPLFAYGTVRRIVYHPPTQALTVSLHDQHVDSDHPIAPHLPQPRIIPIEAQSVGYIAVSVPRVMRRIRSADERNSDEPMVDEQRLFEALTVTAEVAHQDTPFYYNPREGMPQQLRRWGAQIATITTDLDLG